MQVGDLVLYYGKVTVVLDIRQSDLYCKIGVIDPLRWFYNEHGHFIPLEVIYNIPMEMLNTLKLSD